jgi:hypothetical protein
MAVGAQAECQCGTLEQTITERDYAPGGAHCKRVRDPWENPADESRQPRA